MSLIIIVVALIVSLSDSKSMNDEMLIGAFNTSSLENIIPEGWDTLSFRGIDRVTDYELADLNGVRVVHASSDNAASGLVKAVDIEPREYPILEWNWMVSNTLRKGDATKRNGDDYPARIYITFEFVPEHVSSFERIKYNTLRALFGDIPYRAINYIWANKLPIGEAVPNPYTSTVYMIAVQSGDEHLHTMITERRNVLEDYRTFFGEDPPRINGVAIMTDTDNTGESAQAWYGNIRFLKEISE